MDANNDNDITPWLRSALRFGGSFVKTIAEAALRADEENYAILRPALLTLKAKYPKYALTTEEK